MKRSRRLLAGIVLVVAMVAAAGALVHHFAWRGPPPHLAKRLPPLEAMPADLTADQQTAIRLLYSPNPSDRMRGVEQMNTTHVPDEVQVPYLVALLADDPKLQDEPPTSPVESWFWRILGTTWATEDVQTTCHLCLRSKGAGTVGAMIRAIKAEEDVMIRRALVDILVTQTIRQQQWPLMSMPTGTRSITWCPDPDILDALVDVFQKDTDAGVRAVALGAYSTVRETERLSAPSEETATQPYDEGMLPNQPTAVGPHHREALLAAACRDRDMQVRMAALETIARHLGPEAVAPLADALANDPEERVREHAAWLLSSPGADAVESSTLFSRSLHRERPQRPQVVQAMVEVLRQEALHPRAHSMAIRVAMNSALGYLTDQDFGQDAEKWQAWFDKHEADFYPHEAPPIH